MCNLEIFYIIWRFHVVLPPLRQFLVEPKTGSDTVIFLLIQKLSKNRCLRRAFKKFIYGLEEMSQPFDTQKTVYRFIQTIYFGTLCFWLVHVYGLILSWLNDSYTIAKLSANFPHRIGITMLCYKVFLQLRNKIQTIKSLY